MQSEWRLWGSQKEASFFLEQHKSDTILFFETDEQVRVRWCLKGINLQIGRKSNFLFPKRFVIYRSWLWWQYKRWNIIFISKDANQPFTWLEHYSDEGKSKRLFRVHKHLTRPLMIKKREKDEKNDNNARQGEARRRCTLLKKSKNNISLGYMPIWVFPQVFPRLLKIIHNTKASCRSYEI